MGGSQSTRREPAQTQGEHTNSTLINTLQFDCNSKERYCQKNKQKKAYRLCSYHYHKYTMIPLVLQGTMPELMHHQGIKQSWLPPQELCGELPVLLQGNLFYMSLRK